MLNHKRRRDKSAFDAGILTTFGKLDQQDINEVDGHAERLVALLIERYAWSSDVAQSRVESFCVGLTQRPRSDRVAANERVQA